MTTVGDFLKEQGWTMRPNGTWDPPTASLCILCDGWAGDNLLCPKCKSEHAMTDRMHAWHDKYAPHDWGTPAEWDCPFVPECEP